MYLLVFCVHCIRPALVNRFTHIQSPHCPYQQSDNLVLHIIDCMNTYILLAYITHASPPARFHSSLYCHADCFQVLCSIALVDCIGKLQSQLVATSRQLKASRRLTLAIVQVGGIERNGNSNGILFVGINEQMEVTSPYRHRLGHPETHATC